MCTVSLHKKEETTTQRGRQSITKNEANRFIKIKIPFWNSKAIRIMLHFLKKYHQAMKVQQQKNLKNKMHVYVIRKDYLKLLPMETGFFLLLCCTNNPRHPILTDIN